MGKYYVDSCIYLNLWQKEGDESKGIPYWKLAQEFLDKSDSEGSTIYYSGFILKELKYKLPKDIFREKRKMFNESPFLKRVVIDDLTFREARRLESETEYRHGFYDILHTLLAKRTGSVLVTRDKGLIAFARSLSVVAKRPEELL